MPKKLSKRRRIRNTFSVAVVQPDAIRVDSIVSCKYRFSATGAINALPITAGDILAACGSVIVASASTAKPLFSSACIKKIEIWVPSTAGGNNAAEVIWNSGGENVRDEVKVSNTVGASNSTYYVSTPPSKSFSSMWFDSVTPATVWFTLSTAVGSVIDVTISATLANGIAQPANFVITAAGGTGTLFYASLHKYSGATDTIIPIGRPTQI